jgi:hypothetical protein
LPERFRVDCAFGGGIAEFSATALSRSPTNYSARRSGAASRDRMKGAIKETRIKSKFVIPAKAGIHENQ